MLQCMKLKFAGSSNVKKNKKVEKICKTVNFQIAYNMFPGKKKKKKILKI